MNYSKINCNPPQSTRT